MKERLKKTAPKGKSVRPWNLYYEHLSVRLGITQVILYLALFAFVVLSFFRNTQLITYQTFYHFIKDLNASAESAFAVTSNSVSYPTDEQQSFTLYRQGLAVAGNTHVTVFTASGRQSISQNIQYQNPTAVGTGKYLLVYELGGTQYSLYNSYTKIHEGVSDHPINHAAISESGMFALVSSSEGYNSTVSLYSSRFALLNRYNKGGYVVDVTINKKGSQIAILSITPEDGVFTTELMLCKPGATTAQAEQRREGIVGWQCEYTTLDRIALLHEDGMLFYNATGALLEEHSFGGKTVHCVDFDTFGTALCLQSREAFAKNELLVFDKNGKLLYHEIESAEVRQIDLLEQTLFLLCDEGIHRLLLKSGERGFIATTDPQQILLASTENEVLLCSPHRGEYIRFSS